LVSRTWCPRGGWALVASAALSLLLAANAAAASIVVDTNADELDDTDPLTGCTFREAVRAANDDTTFGGCPTGSGPDTITFDPMEFPEGTPTEVIDLVAEGDPIGINTELDIQSPGRDELDVVNSDTTNRIFEVNAGGPVTISGLEISGGNQSGAGTLQGAGIQSFSDLTLDDVELSDNHITVTGDSGSSSDAHAEGAGIWSDGPLTIRDSVIEGNTGTVVNSDDAMDALVAVGGGIWQGGGDPLLVENSSVSANIASTDDTSDGVNSNETIGGGILAGGGVTIAQSTIEGNSALADAIGGSATAKGGGIRLGGLSSQIELSTIEGNKAVVTAPGPTERGDGVMVIDDPMMPVISSTIANNGDASVDTEGANLFAESAGGVTVTNTIIASPVGATGATSNCFEDTPSNIDSNGFNVEYYPGSTTSSCNFTQASDLPDPSDVIGGTDPDLNVLADNGGIGQTMLPALGSPVIDKGSASAQDVTEEDQRGLDRPAFFDSISDAPTGDGSDIGAVEVQIAPPTFAATAPVSPNADETPNVLGAVPAADTADPLVVRLFTNPTCTVATGAPSTPDVFASPGIATGSFAPGTTTTFYGTVESDYGFSHCSTGPFPHTITYTVPGPPQPPPVITPPPAGPTPSAPAKKCKKGFVKKRGKCVKKKKRKTGAK
jgi:hypothetical protein